MRGGRYARFRERALILIPHFAERMEEVRPCVNLPPERILTLRFEEDTDTNEMSPSVGIGFGELATTHTEVVFLDLKIREADAGVEMWPLAGNWNL
jgi:hypothetical protein